VTSNQPLSRNKIRADVDMAFRIIGPSARRNIVEEAVEFGRKLVELQRQVGGGVALARKKQRAAEHLAAAIRKTVAALNDPDLESSLREDFPVDATKALAIGGFIDFDRVVEMGPQEILQIYVELVEQSAVLQSLCPPGMGPAPVAVILAAELLEKFDLPITTTRKPTRSKFLRLAAVFYGDPEANLYKHCCEFKKPRNDGELSVIRMIP
jgi:hypothetical protein